MLTLRPLALAVATALAVPALAQVPVAPVERAAPSTDARPAPAFDADPDRWAAEAASVAGAVTTAPATISYQGLLEEGGEPVGDGEYEIRLGLFDAATDGTALYVEGHTVTTADGTFVLSIGGGAAAGEGAFDDVTFAAPVWVEISVDGTTLTPRTLLQAVPVARTLTAGALIEGDVVAETGGIAALRVRNLGTEGTTNGISGSIRSAFGAGVTGFASSFTGPVAGVAGATFSSEGRGVFGTSFAADGSPRGGAFSVNAPEGVGVEGEHQANTGLGYGVRGESESGGGRGVAGFARATSGTAIGVYGESQADRGVGVRAVTRSESGVTIGVNVLTNSPDGLGAYFLSPGGGLFTAALQNDDVVIDGGDAVLGLYSDPGGAWGSAVVFGELENTGVFNALRNKWAIARRTTAGGGSLRFTYGTDARYGQNETLMRIDTNGNVRADGSFIGGGADLAEFFPLADGATVEPGQVVGLRAGRVSLDTDGAEQIGIASSDPAFVGNPDAEVGGALVALVGQVEVRIAAGDVAAPGDVLVASGYGDGTARAVASDAYALADGPVIGRVLTVEGGRALALVGVDEAAALRAVVSRQAGRIADLEGRLARLETLLAPTATR